jgi:hypothetical protein
VSRQRHTLESLIATCLTAADGKSPAINRDILMAQALTEIDRRLTALEERTARIEDDMGPASDRRGE